MTAVSRAGTITIIIAIAGLLLVSACDSGISQEEVAERKLWGHHCLNGWDGNHDGFETQIRGLLNDPDSMDTHATKTTQKLPNGFHRISMDYSAKNSFGGRVRLSAIGWLDPESCEVEVYDYGFN